MTLIGPDEIGAARARVAPILRPTPLEVSDSLSELAGRRVWLKPENRQLTGSYKIRGAYNLIAQLEAGVEVVAASAGNHAQGVARAARLTGRPATIFMPTTTPLPKVAATRADGATIRLEGDLVDESIERARVYAADTGAVFIHPYDDPRVIAGQGTLGLELADEIDGPATVFVPIGGGGLIAGVAAGLAGVRRDITVVGVQAEGSAAMRASLDAGRVVALDHVRTIADGCAVKSVSDLTFQHVRAHVASVITVSDDQISRALLLLLERSKVVVEPAGAIALAAVLAGTVPGPEPAVAVLSGGNVDPLLLIHLIEHGLSAAGRYLILRVVLEDRPGALAGLTEAVAGLGLNVLEVEHHRVGVRLGVDKVEVLLTLETRDPEHRDEAVRALRDKGFAVELMQEGGETRAGGELTDP